MEKKKKQILRVRGMVKTFFFLRHTQIVPGDLRHWPNFADCTRCRCELTFGPLCTQHYCYYEFQYFFLRSSITGDDVTATQRTPACNWFWRAPERSFFLFYWIARRRTNFINDVYYYTRGVESLLLQNIMLNTIFNISYYYNVCFCFSPKKTFKHSRKFQ